MDKSGKILNDPRSSPNDGQMRLAPTSFSMSYCLRSIISSSSCPVPIIATLRPITSSIFSTKFLAWLDRLLNSLLPESEGKTISSFVKATCVALFNMTYRLASAKLNGEALLSRPVTLPNSVHPFEVVSSCFSSPSRGPDPTLVTYAL
jgi:hypothetical protein